MLVEGPVEVEVVVCEPDDEEVLCEEVLVVFEAEVVVWEVVVPLPLPGKHWE